MRKQQFHHFLVFHTVVIISHHPAPRQNRPTLEVEYPTWRSSPRFYALNQKVPFPFVFFPVLVEQKAERFPVEASMPYHSACSSMLSHRHNVSQTCVFRMAHDSIASTRLCSPLNFISNPTITATIYFFVVSPFPLVISV
jgi:hypothetical protein